VSVYLNRARLSRSFAKSPTGSQEQESASGSDPSKRNLQETRAQAIGANAWWMSACHGAAQRPRSFEHELRNITSLSRNSEKKLDLSKPRGTVLRE
jgi:hypothetical protein